MKTLSSIIFLFILTISIYCQDPLAGSWKGIDENGDIGYLLFDKDGFVSIIIKNDTLGGKEFIQNDIKACMTYKLNRTISPNNLDLIVTRLDTNEEVGRVLGIIEFIDNNKIKLRINFERSERPKDFLPEGNTDTVFLEKVKE